jgi:lysozyme
VPALGALVEPQSTSHAAPAVDLMGSTWGVDLSNHNAGASIAKAHAAGCSFVFAKATEGLTFTDSRFAGFRADAHAAGVPFGAYHFAKPQHGRAAADEAHHFVNTIGTVRVGELPPVLDLEWTLLPPNATAAWASTWLQTVHTLTGALPMIYASPSFLGSKVAARSAGLSRYPLWLASYRSTTPTAPAPWGSWLFWQHSSTSHVPGIPGNVDRNVTRLTPAGVRGLCVRPPATAPVHHAPAPKPAPHRPAPVHHAPAPHKPAPKPAVVRTKAGGVVLGARVLSEGDHGPDVAWLQRFLGVTADASFGPKTEAAVKRYQDMRGLAPDGEVGRKTWANLLSRH